MTLHQGREGSLVATKHEVIEQLAIARRVLFRRHQCANARQNAFEPLIGHVFSLGRPRKLPHSSSVCTTQLRHNFLLLKQKSTPY